MHLERLDILTGTETQSVIMITEAPERKIHNYM
jgi:hypothetical protein